MNGVLNNLDEHKCLKQELQKLKDDYQNLFDESPVAMFVEDSNTSELIGVNKAALNSYGYTKEEFTSLRSEDIYLSESSIGNTEEGTPYCCHYKKSGEALYVQVKKKKIVYHGIDAYLMTVIDVTSNVLEQEKANQGLNVIFNSTQNRILKSVAEQRFTALVQKGADIVGILDKMGNFKYVSPNIESILGYKPGYLYEQSSLSLIHSEDVFQAHTELEKVIAGGEVKLTAYRCKHSNGEWRWFETIATNQLDNPAINGIVINSRDITSRKKIETEHELMIKELLKSNADLKQFSFITSHNLRAPLSNIIGILTIIDFAGLSDYNRQMLDMLHISSKQLQQTIDDLSKILVIKNDINIEISNINLDQSIDEVKGTFINALNDLCVDIYTDFRVQEINFNKTYFQSILVNLLSNSIKFKSVRRNLVINMFSDIDADGTIIFKFSDNGLGLDLNMHRNKVFGLYQRFHENIEGQGLGLFIIKSQIVALGGKIDIESEPDKGTTFTITFKNPRSV